MKKRNNSWSRNKEVGGKDFPNIATWFDSLTAGLMADILLSEVMDRFSSFELLKDNVKAGFCQLLPILSKGKITEPKPEQVETVARVFSGKDTTLFVSTGFG